MDPQTIFLPAKPRVHRKRRVVSASSAPTLVAAAFGIDDGPFVTLTFDVAVSALGFDIFSLTVDQQVEEVRYSATSAELLDPVTVKVALFADVPCPAGPDVLLTASGNTNIVAQGGGAEWSGVEGLGLPYP